MKQLEIQQKYPFLTQNEITQFLHSVQLDPPNLHQQLNYYLQKQIERLIDILKLMDQLKSRAMDSSQKQTISQIISTLSKKEIALLVNPLEELILYKENVSKRQISVEKNKQWYQQFVLVYQQFGFQILEEDQQHVTLGLFDNSKLETIQKQIAIIKPIRNVTKERIEAQFQAMERRKQMLNSSDDPQEQIREYRQQMKGRPNDASLFPQKSNKHYTSKNRVVTMSQMEQVWHKEMEIKFAKRAFEVLLIYQLTNQFRKQKKKPLLKWNDQLARIAYPHSENMGLRRVAFDHIGFYERANKVSFNKTYFCENLAYNDAYQESPQLSVNGWINSAGHRKNLLSNTNLCGIGVFRSPYGEWYYTQLFAKA